MKNSIGTWIKAKRREMGFTQEQFSIYSGLGRRFIRELEQGKATVRMDKVEVALSMLGYHLEPVKDED